MSKLWSAKMSYQISNSSLGFLRIDLKQSLLEFRNSSSWSIYLTDMHLESGKRGLVALNFVQQSLNFVKNQQFQQVYDWFFEHPNAFAAKAFLSLRIASNLFKQKGLKIFKRICEAGWLV